MQKKHLLILGSTGTVGTKTLDVIRKNPSLYTVDTLVGGSNVELMARQIMEFHPKRVVLHNESHAALLKDRVQSSCNTKIYGGMDAILDIAADPYDICVSAIVGIASLKPTLHAMRGSRIVAIASKEAVIAGGNILLNEAQKYNAKIIPLDSEHNAIFQLLGSTLQCPKNVKKIILTASGGPLWGYSKEEMKYVTIAQVLKHPKWDMGAKISVDSASMMNKGLELIEAAYLFNVEMDKLDVLVHPEAIVHGLIEYTDGAIVMHCGINDMFLPIEYALSWPYRASVASSKLDLTRYQPLNFTSPDYERFPLLRLAREAFIAGHSSIITMNAANEHAVNLFLQGFISFLDIHTTIEKALTHSTASKLRNVDEILALDAEIKSFLSLKQFQRNK